MNSIYTALIALLRAGGIHPAVETLTPGETGNTQFSVRLRPETRIFFDACAERMGIDPYKLKCLSFLRCAYPEE